MKKTRLIVFLLVLSSAMLTYGISSAQLTVYCQGLPANVIGSGGPGNSDYIDVSEATGPQIIHGRGGDDIIIGSDYDDIICGGSGDDIIWGNEGNDSIRGGPDHDILYGEQGFDSLYGGQGNDRLVGGTEGDAMYGGPDNDDIFAQDNFPDSVISGGGGSADGCAVDDIIDPEPVGCP